MSDVVWEVLGTNTELSGGLPLKHGVGTEVMGLTLEIEIKGIRPKNTVLLEQIYMITKKATAIKKNP